MTRLLRNALPFAAALLLSSCSAPNGPNGPDDTNAPVRGHGIDSIVVTFSPSGDLNADDARRTEVTDPETIAAWVQALDAVPETPKDGVVLIKFRAPISQHRVELRSGDEIVRVARMRNGLLDVAAHEGWAFYSGEDAAFVALVNAALPGA